MTVERYVERMRALTRSIAERNGRIHGRAPDLPPGSLIRARYTEPAEFLADLERDKDEVEGNLVRVTKIGRHVPATSITRVAVHAGAIVRGRVIALERYTGDLLGTATDDAVQEATDAIVRELEERIAGMGLELRAGVWEEDDRG